jgi:hypothetical protein
MEIKKRPLKPISRFSAVMLVLYILPSEAFASENKPSPAPPAPEENITEENITEEDITEEDITEEDITEEDITEKNFADAHVETLDSINDSINEQIAELQGFHTNLSESSEASYDSELQEGLSNKMPANRYGPDEINMEPCRMDRGTGGMLKLFGFSKVESITDDNYTDFQVEMVYFLGNMTEILSDQLTDTTDESMTEAVNEQIADLETLSSEINAASGAKELQGIILTYAKTQTVDSLEMEIGYIEEIKSKSESTTDENMSESHRRSIIELNALIEEINGAESLENLMKIISSSRKCSE